MISQNKIGINISVGRSCFVKCTGCYNFFGKEKKPLDTKTILDFLGLASKYGFEKVTFDGGDPLSRPDIIDLVEETKKLNYKISLDTVGTPLLKDQNTIFFGRSEVKQVAAERLAKNIDMLGIPLDGSTAEIAKLFRTGRDNFFGEQLEILTLLNGYKTNLCLNTVAHKMNVNDIPAMFGIIEKFSSIKMWQIFQYMPIGPLGYKNRDQFLICENAFKLLEDTLNAKIQKTNIPADFILNMKSCSSRKGIYMLIDSDGFAWMPKYCLKTKQWDDKTDTNNQRFIFGNIRNPDDQARILEYMSNPAEALKYMAA